MKKIEQVITGLQIVAKYDATGYSVAAEHDILYASVPDIDKMSEEDKQAIRDAGWSWDSSLPSFYIFVSMTND